MSSSFLNVQLYCQGQLQVTMLGAQNKTLLPEVVFALPIFEKCLPPPNQSLSAERSLFLQKVAPLPKINSCRNELQSRLNQYQGESHGARRFFQDQSTLFATIYVIFCSKLPFMTKDLRRQNLPFILSIFALQISLFLYFFPKAKPLNPDPLYSLLENRPSLPFSLRSLLYTNPETDAESAIHSAQKNTLSLNFELNAEEQTELTGLIERIHSLVCSWYDPPLQENGTTPPLNLRLAAKTKSDTWLESKESLFRKVSWFSWAPERDKEILKDAIRAVHINRGIFQLESATH